MFCTPGWRREQCFELISISGHGGPKRFWDLLAEDWPRMILISDLNESFSHISEELGGMVPPTWHWIYQVSIRKSRTTLLDPGRPPWSQHWIGEWMHPMSNLGWYNPRYMHRMCAYILHIFTVICSKSSEKNMLRIYSRSLNQEKAQLTKPLKTQNPHTSQTCTQTITHTHMGCKLLRFLACDIVWCLLTDSVCMISFKFSALYRDSHKHISRS